MLHKAFKAKKLQRLNDNIAAARAWTNQTFNMAHGQKHSNSDNKHDVIVSQNTQN